MILLDTSPTGELLMQQLDFLKSCAKERDTTPKHGQNGREKLMEKKKSFLLIPYLKAPVSVSAEKFRLINSHHVFLIQH